MLHKQSVTITVTTAGLLSAVKKRFPKCRVKLVNNFILILDKSIGFQRWYRSGPYSHHQTACTHIIKMPDALFRKHCNTGSGIAGKYRLTLVLANDDGDKFLFDWRKR